MKEFAYIHEEGTLPEPLDRIAFFESFQGRHLNDILYSSYFIQADPGDEVIKEGQEDSRIFVLLTGSLEVMKNGEALATLVVNKIRGTFKSVAVKAPGFGDRRKAMLQDMAILTGGKVVSEELGMTLEKVTLHDLGRAKRVVITKDATTIVGGEGRKEAIKGRCNELRAQIKATTSDYDREKLQERLAKLSGGVAVVRVGAPSESEMKARKDAFDDAISSTKAAIAEGIVPGGGLALLRTIDAVEREAVAAEGDERTGLLILKRALEAPARQIAENSASDDGVVVSKMREGTGNYGFDASCGVYVDLVQAGIIDPTKVVRTACKACCGCVSETPKSSSSTCKAGWPSSW